MQYLWGGVAHVLERKHTNVLTLATMALLCHTCGISKMINEYHPLIEKAVSYVRFQSLLGQDVVIYKANYCKITNRECHQTIPPD